jgi:hypothetical protein
MNRFPLVCIKAKNYSLSKYVTRFEIEYYKNLSDLCETEVSYRRTYKLNNLFIEKIIDVKFPRRNIFGYVTGYWYF